MRRILIALAVLAVPAIAVAADVILDGPSGNVRQKGTPSGAAYVYLASRDGGLGVTQPQPWTVDSNACIAAAVSGATGGEDGGRLKSFDGGVAESGKLYRCFNPSGSVGDICLRSSSTTPFTCNATAMSMQVAPGGVEWTMLTDPVMVSSSSGAASLICCPVVY